MKQNSTARTVAIISTLSVGALAGTLEVPGQYASIQAAVDAAVSGDIIRIAAGDHAGQVVVVDKSITLIGEPGTVLRATSDMSEALLPFDGLYGSGEVPLLAVVRSEVVLKGLTLDGSYLGDVYLAAGLRLRGISLFGSAGRIEECMVQRFRGTSGQATRAYGLDVVNPVSLGTPIIDLEVSSSTFTDNENSISIRGGPVDEPLQVRTRFLVESNSILGLGPSAVTLDGILVVNGATGDVRHNTIAGHINTGATARALRVQDGRASARDPQRLIPALPVRVEGNTFSNNTVSIAALQANEFQVVNNVFVTAGAPPVFRGLALSGTNILVANNDFSGLPTGIWMFTGEMDSGVTNVSLGIAVNPHLLGNRFCDVTRQVLSGATVPGLKIERHETCPFEPRFDSFTRMGNGEFGAKLRGWRGETVVIEASTDLRLWSPVQTNVVTSPLLDFREAAPPPTSPRFYRAFRP